VGQSKASRLLKKANAPVFASAVKQSSATFPEERSCFHSVRNRFMDCFIALLLAMTAEDIFSSPASLNNIQLSELRSDSQCRLHAIDAAPSGRTVRR
jgi:hypothetical protein